MVLGFALLALAGLYLVSGYKGQSLAATLRGELGGRFPLADLANVPGVDFVQAVQAKGAEYASLGSTGGGTAPKGDALAFVRWVEAVGRKHGLSVTSAHRPHDTDSDHGSRDRTRAASDISNGNSPTPEMDAAVREVAAGVGQRVSGTSPVELNVNYGGMRIQILYRTQVGGNHDNHIHAGARLV